MNERERALEKMVEAAYREGWADGISDEQDGDETPTADEAWAVSLAYKALMQLDAEREADKDV